MQKFKKFFSIIYGSENKNVYFCVSIASLITSIVLAILAFLFKSDKSSSLFFTYAATIFFSIWLILTYGANSAEKLACEGVRLVIFFSAFIVSLLYLLQINISKNYFFGIFACLGLFLSCIYFIFKLNAIFDFVKTIFKQLKLKLFNTDKPTPSGIKSVIENVTVFLVSIGGFSIALKTIIETLLQIYGYFK